MQASTELGSITRVHAPKARSAAHAPATAEPSRSQLRRFTMSAKAPAGSVNRKNGADAAVAMSDSVSDEAPRSCINHVALNVLGRDDRARQHARQP